MSKTFRPWLIDQPQLLPASVEDFVPPDHLAHFVRDLVREQLDLSAILASYVELRGYPPFDPRMMTALLLYGYSRGVYSSRRLARGCQERVDFMAVTAMNRPDFRTISEFRRRHGAVLSGLFVQVLRLCQEAGLVELGHVALDGTKMKANASKHKAMSYGRMKKTEPELAAEVDGWLKAAEAADAEEDALHGVDRRGDEKPDWMATKERRLAKIREAKAALEAEATAEAEEKAKQPKRYRGGRKPKQEPGTPPDKAQRNFTDPESKIQKTPDGFIQGYNAQAAVDATAQVIVAQDVTPMAADVGHLVPLVTAIGRTLRQRPRQVLADAGYCSDDTLKALGRKGIAAYIATGRHKHGEALPPAPRGRPPTGLTRRERMARTLRTKLGRAIYARRKAIVEPVFGQIKHARGFRQFLRRGQAAVRAEWALLCTAHNILKLYTAGAWA